MSWQEFERQERRRAILRAVGAWIVIILSAIGTATVVWVLVALWIALFGTP